MVTPSSRLVSLFAFGCFASALAVAQPLLHYRGIVNSASRMPAGLPGGTIARGALFSMAGTAIGPANSPDPSDPPATTLGSVSITITQGTTTVNAIPVMVSPTRVDAIMPPNVPLGLVSVRLTYNNARSNPVTLQVVATQFGIFTYNNVGVGPANAQIVADDGTATDLTQQSPAAPGQNVAITGTGLGGLGTADVTVSVGGVTATILTAGPLRTAGNAGRDQILLTIPADAPLGCWTPVYIKTKTAVSNVATLAISSDGSACTEPNNALAAALVNGGNQGIFAAARFNVRHDAGVLTPRDSITDLFGAYQFQQQAGPYNFNPVYSFPPAGSCTVYGTTADFYGVHDLMSTELAKLVGGILPSGYIQTLYSPPGVDSPPSSALDAGDISLTGDKGTVTTIKSPYPGGSAVQLGGSIPSLPLSNRTFLDSGGMTVNLAGGPDITAASADSPVPQSFLWSNRDQTLNIVRSKGLTLNWTGGPPEASVILLGGNVDVPTNSSAAFLCVVPPGTKTFTVPAESLANIPVSRQRAIQSLGAVYVIQMNLTSPAGVGASGLDFSAFVPIAISGKTVSFQ